MTRGVINIKTDRMNEILGQFAGLKGKVPLALSRAINRSVSSAKSEAVRQARNAYTVKAATVRDTIRVSKASPNKLQAEVKSSGRSVRMYDFKVSPKNPSPRRRAPINVEIRRGSRKALKGAFVARMGNGTTGVFSRSSKARLPIEQLFGPAVPVMLNNDDVVNAVQERAEEQLERRIGHEINRVLGVK